MIASHFYWINHLFGIRANTVITAVSHIVFARVVISVIGVVVIDAVLEFNVFGFILL